MEGIFSDKERKIQHEKQAQRHTKSYIHQHTTRLNIHNRRDENKENKNEHMGEKSNPILMIGQIHAERANNIEEMIAQKRSIKNNTNNNTTKTTTNNTINNNLEKLRQLFPETIQPNCLSSPNSSPNPSTLLPNAHTQWEALLAVDRSKACLASLKH